MTQQKFIPGQRVQGVFKQTPFTGVVLKTRLACPLAHSTAYDHELVTVVTDEPCDTFCGRPMSDFVFNPENAPYLTIEIV